MARLCVGQVLTILAAIIASVSSYNYYYRYSYGRNNYRTYNTYGYSYGQKTDKTYNTYNKLGNQIGKVAKGIIKNYNSSSGSPSHFGAVTFVIVLVLTVYLCWGRRTAATPRSDEGVHHSTNENPGETYSAQ